MTEQEERELHEGLERLRQHREAQANARLAEMVANFDGQKFLAAWAKAKSQ